MDQLYPCLMCHGRERLLEAHHARFSAAPPISSDVLASSMLLRAGYSGTPQHNQETRWTLESYRLFASNCFCLSEKFQVPTLFSSFLATSSPIVSWTADVNFLK